MPALPVRLNVAKLSAVGRCIVFCTAMLCLLLAPRLGAAATVELPLHLRIDLLQRLLADYLSPPPERTAVLFQQGACRYLRTDNPRLEIRAGRLYFTTHGSASLGIEAMGNCPASLTWKGTIEVALASYVDPQWRLRYRIIDSKIVDEKGAEPKVTGFIWDFTKRFLHPRLEGFAFDLAPPRQEISLSTTGEGIGSRLPVPGVRSVVCHGPVPSGKRPWPRPRPPCCASIPAWPGFRRCSGPTRT